MAKATHDMWMFSEEGERLFAEGEEIPAGYFDSPAKVPRKKQAAEGIGTDSGDQFSDEQLRDAIKTATGKAPGPRTSREKLVERFNELNGGE